MTFEVAKLSSRAANKTREYGASGSLKGGSEIDQGPWGLLIHRLAGAVSWG